MVGIFYNVLAVMKNFTRKFLSILLYSYVEIFLNYVVIA